MLSFGLLFPRILRGRRGARTQPRRVDARRRTSRRSRRLVIGLPMLVVAFATLLVSHSLFPDETDFRVLLALPVSRRRGLPREARGAARCSPESSSCVAHVAMLPLFMLVAVGGRGQASVLLRFGAHAVASLGGSTFAVLAVTAIYGALLMWMPRRRLADRIDGGAKRDALRDSCFAAARGEDCRRSRRSSPPDPARRCISCRRSGFLVSKSVCSWTSVSPDFLRLALLAGSPGSRSSRSLDGGQQSTP